MILEGKWLAPSERSESRGGPGNTMRMKVSFP